MTKREEKAHMYARRQLRDGCSPAEAARGAAESYGLSTAAELRLIKTLRALLADKETA